MSTPSGSTSAPRRVVLLGSTGSIGTQALDIVRAHPERFVVTGLAAGGGRPDLLAQQAAEFGVPTLAVADPAAAPDLRERTGADVLAGPEAAAELAGSGADVVLNAMDGSRGLAPTLAALAAGSTLALANKESLVAGGPLVTRTATPGQLVPVDSEHSALAQCLRGGRAEEVGRLVLTASGGPFRGRSRERARRRHRRPGAGPPHLGDGAGGDAELVDAGEQGARADRGPPAVRRALRAHRRRRPPAVDDPLDGHLRRRRDDRPGQPARHAHADRARPRLARAPRRREPARRRSPTRRAGPSSPSTPHAFPALDLARAAGSAGGCLPAVYNAANEEAVAAFLAGRCAWTGIDETLAAVLDDAGEWAADPGTVADVLAAEDWARARARERLVPVP